MAIHRKLSYLVVDAQAQCEHDYHVAQFRTLRQAMRLLRKLKSEGFGIIRQSRRGTRDGSYSASWSINEKGRIVRDNRHYYKYARMGHTIASRRRRTILTCEGKPYFPDMGDDIPF